MTHARRTTDHDPYRLTSLWAATGLAALHAAYGGWRALAAMLRGDVPAIIGWSVGSFVFVTVTLDVLDTARELKGWIRFRTGDRKRGVR